MSSLGCPTVSIGLAAQKATATAAWDANSTELERLLASAQNLAAQLDEGIFEGLNHDCGDDIAAAIERNDRPAVCEMLVKDPMLANSPNSEGRTPLHTAAGEGNADLVELLLSHGASENAIDCCNNTPLDVCLLWCKDEAARDRAAAVIRRWGGIRRGSVLGMRGSEEDMVRLDSGDHHCLLDDRGGSRPSSPGNSWEWNEITPAAYVRDSDVSEPQDVLQRGSGTTSSFPCCADASVDFGDVQDAIRLPPPGDVVSPVSFIDPNSRNELVFKLENDEVFYEVKGTRRPALRQVEFVSCPTRLMFPAIGMCASLPITNLEPILLGRLRDMFTAGGVQHDIPNVVMKRRDTMHWNADAANLVIVMMGLPGRGKTFIAQRLCRWLNWKGVRTRIFHAQTGSGDHKAVEAMVSFLKDTPGAVGVLGATRCYASDRKRLLQAVSSVAGTERVLFVEAASTSPELIRLNVVGPGTVSDEERQDTMKEHDRRVGRHMERYQSLSEHTDGQLSYVQLCTQPSSGGGRVNVNKVSGHLSLKLLFFLLNLHPANTTTYLVRTGECLHQVANKVGGDSELTAKGWQHAAAVRRFFNLKEHRHRQMQVFGSTMQRAAETQSCFSSKRFVNVQSKTLNEINAAECDGMTPDEIRQKFPQLWRKRSKDKYYYGWPRGESYANMNQRLEQVILDVHRSVTPVLIIGHLDVCRGMYAYLSEMLPELCVYLSLPQSHIYEFNYVNGTRLDIRAHDISGYIEDAARQNISSVQKPSCSYLNSTPPAPPPQAAPPQLPDHVKDIMQAGGTGQFHQKSLSTDTFELADSASGLQTPDTELSCAQSDRGTPTPMS